MEQEENLTDGRERTTPLVLVRSMDDGLCALERLEVTVDLVTPFFQFEVTGSRCLYVSLDSIE